MPTESQALPVADRVPPDRYVPSIERVWYPRFKTPQDEAGDLSFFKDRGATEKILNVLRPYASNWNGTLGRGDLVVPQREIPHLIHEILDAVRDTADRRGEASELDVFQALSDARRLSSVQEQAERLRATFIILKR